MSKYTVELREIVETFSREEVEGYFKDYNLEDYLTEQEISVINERGTWSKDRLARKIVDHYYMREIGVETVGLFIQRAKVAMQEIMEEKLPLIYSAAIKYDPLINVDYSETYAGTNNATNNATSSQTAKNSTTDATSNQSATTGKTSGLNVNSDTPQGQISKSSILGGSYASSTSANDDESSSQTSNNASSLSDSETTTQGNTSGTNNQTQNYTKTVKGNSGVSATAQKMIQQYRENIIMIDRDIIKDLASLFMGVY